MALREIHMTRHVVLLPDHHDFFLRLKEIDRRHGIEQEARHADRPAPLLRRKRGFAGKRPLIGFPQRLPHPRLQDGIAQVRNAERWLLAVSPRGAIVDIGMRFIVRDRSRPARRGNELLPDRVLGAWHACDPSRGIVRGKIGNRNILRAQRRPQRDAGREQCERDAARGDLTGNQASLLHSASTGSTPIAFFRLS
jgi:hypothetical protein